MSWRPWPLAPGFTRGLSVAKSPKNTVSTLKPGCKILVAVASLHCQIQGHLKPRSNRCNWITPILIRVGGSRALYGPTVVKTRTFREIWGHWPYEFQVFRIRSETTQSCMHALSDACCESSPRKREERNLAMVKLRTDHGSYHFNFSRLWLTMQG